MVIVVGGIKGGSGKTTIATNLAVIRSAESRDVLLMIDADDQETATDFTILRNERTEGNAGYTSIKLAGPAVRTQTLRLEGKYQDIIIDTGGRDTTSQRAALTLADLLLVPFVPRSFDIWTLEKVGALVGEMQPANLKPKAFAFLNRAEARGQDNDEAISFLRESPALGFIDTPIGSRKAFSNAVTELRPPDQKAIDEVLMLYRYIFDINLKSQDQGAS
jgi:chromosome partitioning protein